MSFQFTPLQENFTAGEFGKRMEARTLFEKYTNAGKTFENILPLPQGGWTYRPGYRYVVDAKSASVRPWLLPFIYSTEQTYILELGENSVRFFRNQGQIAALATDASITNGTFPSGITSWTDRSSGTGAIAHDATDLNMELQAAGTGNEARAYQTVVVTNTNIEHVLKFEIVGDPGDTAIVRVGSSIGGGEHLAKSRREVGYHTVAFTPDSTPFYVEFECDLNKTVSIDNVAILNDEPIELVTPWTEDQLPDISYAQSADVLYMAIGGTTRVYKFERYDNASWSLIKSLFEDGPWLPKNATSTTLSLSAASGNGITVTASAVTGINDDTGFQENDVGRLIRWEDSGGAWVWLQIVSRSSTTVVLADIMDSEPVSTAGTVSWRLGEWCDSLGWPSVVGFIQQRLGFAATLNAPQTFWLSKSAEIENFQDEDGTGATVDDSSIAYRFAALRVNTIRWMASRKKPVIGTIGGNWTLRSDGAVLTPSDIAADFEVTTGVLKLPPLEVRSRLLYAQAQGRKLLEFADVLQDSGVQGFDAFDLTLLNDRVLKGGLKQLAFQQEPDSMIWAVREDGQAAVLTYQPEQSVIGWSRQIHGGDFDGEGAVIESVATIPGQNGSGQFKDSTDRYEVWVAVKMTINGSTVRYIEVLERVFNGDEDLQQDAFYVDSGITLDNPISIASITQATTGVLETSTAHGLSDGDLVRPSRIVGMTELNASIIKVANSTSTTFELNDADDNAIDTTGYGAYVKNGEIREMVSSVSGLSHLEGATVSVFGDGAAQTDKVVSSGSVTLDQPAGLVHVGLPYTRTWDSLKLAFGAVQDGTSIGRLKNVGDLVLVVMETAEGAFTAATVDADGVNEMAELDLRRADDIDEDPVPFFSGEVRLGLESGFDTDLRLRISGDRPVPATVLALTPEQETAQR